MKSQLLDACTGSSSLEYCRHSVCLEEIFSTHFSIGKPPYFQPSQVIVTAHARGRTIQTLKDGTKYQLQHLWGVYIHRKAGLPCAKSFIVDSYICKWKKDSFRWERGKKQPKLQEGHYCRIEAGAGMELCLPSLFSLCTCLFISGSLSERSWSCGFFWNSGTCLHSRLGPQRK